MCSARSDYNKRHSHAAAANNFEPRVQEEVEHAVRMSAKWKSRVFRPQTAHTYMHNPLILWEAPDLCRRGRVVAEGGGGPEKLARNGWLVVLCFAGGDEWRMLNFICRTERHAGRGS